MDDEALITWGGDDFPRPLRVIVARISAEYPPEITVEQGWRPLLVRLDAQVAAIDRYDKVRRVAPEVGHLSFELDPSTTGVDLQRMANAAARESAVTCELCGRPGMPQSSPTAF